MDFGFELFDFGVDLGEGSGWDVSVEVAGEGDFVADLGLVVVDPGVGYVGVDFGGEVVVDGGAVLGGGEPVGDVGCPLQRSPGERHVLVVAQVAVRLRDALLVSEEHALGVGNLCGVDEGFGDVDGDAAAHVVAEGVGE